MSYPMPSTKIAFILSSNSSNPLPSTRISVFNMFPYLVAAGYDPVIAFEPPTSTETPDLTGLAPRLEAQGIEIAYFQKVHGPKAEAEVAQLRARGIKTIFGVCDRIEDGMAAATDATVAVTEYLKGLYAPEVRDKVHVVHDGIESPEMRQPAAVPASDVDSARISAVLVTSSQLNEIPILGKPPSFLDVTVIGRYPPRSPFARHWREIYWKTRGLANWRDKFSLVRHQFRKDFNTSNWDPRTVHGLTAAADIGIIPVDMRHEPIPNRDVSYWQVKSENRLTLTMALALPVVASPVPAYLDVIDQGKNGFIATTRKEWRECLGELRDPALRRRIGESARESVIHRFSKAEQARKLIAVLDKLRDVHRA